MATALKLRSDIKKLKKGLEAKGVSASIKEKLKIQLEKAEKELESLKKTGKAPKKSSVKGTKSALDALSKLVQKKKFAVYQGQRVDLKKDAAEGALPTGRRVSKGLKANQFGGKGDNKGKVYYEYRPNRLDVKQPKKSQKYPKLEDGGETSDGKIRFDMYGYVKANNRVQDGDEIIRVSSYKEAEKKAEKYLNDNKYELVELYRKDDFVGSIRTKKNFAYSSRYKKEDFADGGSIPEGYHQMPDGTIMADSAHMAKGGYMAEGGVIFLKSVSTYFRPSDMTVSSEKSFKNEGEIVSLHDVDDEWINKLSVEDNKTIFNSMLSKHLKDAKSMASGGIYSSEELYIVKVFDGKSGELLDMSKRVWAKNMSQAQRIAMEDFEDEMKAKYGDHLRFKIEEAPSMMKKGGSLDSKLKKYATEDVNLLQKEGGMAITDTKLGVIFGEHKGGVFTFTNRDGKNLFSGNKEEAIDFVKNNYQVEGMARGGYMEDGGYTHEGHDLVDINGKKIKEGDVVKTTQPSGGILSPSEGQIGIVEKTKDAFGQDALQIRFRKEGKNYDQLILLNGKINEIISREKGGYMAEGGEIEVGDYVMVQNPHWFGGMGAEKAVRRKVTYISPDKSMVAFADDSTSSMEYVKKIDKKMEVGGFVESTTHRNSN